MKICTNIFICLFIILIGFGCSNKELIEKMHTNFTELMNQQVNLNQNQKELVKKLTEKKEYKRDESTEKSIKDIVNIAFNKTYQDIKIKSDNRIDKILIFNIEPGLKDNEQSQLNAKEATYRLRNLFSRKFDLVSEADAQKYLDLANKLKDYLEQEAESLNNRINKLIDTIFENASTTQLERSNIKEKIGQDLNKIRIFNKINNIYRVYHNISDDDFYPRAMKYLDMTPLQDELYSKKQIFEKIKADIIKEYKEAISNTIPDELVRSKIKTFATKRAIFYLDQRHHEVRKQYFNNDKINDDILELLAIVGLNPVKESWIKPSINNTDTNQAFYVQFDKIVFNEFNQNFTDEDLLKLIKAKYNLHKFRNSGIKEFFGVCP